MRLPLIIDFSMNRGHEMIVDRKDGIRRTELDELELQMLQSGKIPHLLPVEWLEIDGRVTFRYALAGRKMLLHRLQVQPLTMEQFYTLLLGIVETFDECKHYMLRPEGCLLDDQYLFVGEQLNDIAVAYVPLRESESNGIPGAGDLLSLIVRWTAYIQDIDGAGLQCILQPLNGNKWPISELRSVLLGLIGDSFIQHVPQQLSQMREKIIPAFPVSPERVAEQLDREHVSSNPRSAYDNATPVKSNIPMLELEEQEHNPEAARRKMWITAAVAVIVIACVWKYIYLPSHSKSSLYISLGLTFMGIAALYMVWSRRLPAELLAKPSEDDIIDEFVPESQPLGMWPRYGGEESEKRAYHDASVISIKRESEFYGYEKNTADLHSKHKHAEAMAAEATVLLMDQEEVSSEYAIYREWAGGGTWLDWRDSKFTVGRLGEQVSYEEEAHGISRLHLELEREEGSYRAKDLGSRNGSMLNGESMIPYKSYLIKPGDTVQLAGSNGPKYVLKTGG
ncbi:DUF6382 domain-containing protein [Paenibacillus glycanilyticus]|uniref:FHA domain-containing protein n=1 Tax=Paenibacillus glycanilyticus TaxID=126569 RepID=A0ABQ6G9N6_9BACL|nr:DUF6382 domain-containing protein [Paenibacillus glycanilyticus]GLX67674.1 hypothetical protein MU1_20190 [Paenibacillus glycanilyticus]